MKYLRIVFACLIVMASVPVRGSDGRQELVPGKLYGQNEADAIIPEAATFRAGQDGRSLSYIRLKPGTGITPNAFFHRLREYFPIAPPVNLHEVGRTQDPDLEGYVHYTYQQYYKGYRVAGGVYKVHTLNGFVVSAGGDFFRLGDIPAVLQLSSLMAENKAKQHLQSELARHGKGAGADGLKVKDRQLVVTNGEGRQGGKPFKLVYQLNVHSFGAAWLVTIDAATGEVISSREAGCHITATANTLYEGNRSFDIDFPSVGAYKLISSNYGGTSHTIHTYEFGWNGTQEMAYEADNPVSNYGTNHQSATQAHHAAQRTFDYWTTYGITQSDDLDMIVDMEHAPGDGMNTAYYLYPNELYFGKGSTPNGNFAGTDIVGHEMMHMLHFYELNTYYYGEEPAIINEAYADINGVMVENYIRSNNCNQFSSPNQCTTNWLIGEDAVSGGIRSISNPSSKGHPHTYYGNNWYYGPDYTEESHRNSSVITYCFSLLANGGSGTNDRGYQYSVVGINRFKAARIFYKAFTDYLTEYADIHDLYTLTLDAAEALYGYGSNEYNRTIQAWNAVGIPFIYADEFELSYWGTSGNSYDRNRGIGIIDVTGDDVDDLYVNPENEKIKMLENNGTGGMALLYYQNIKSAHGQSWGDFDNDGDLDLYIPRGSPYRVDNTSLPQELANLFLRNDGNGSFTDMATLNPGPGTIVHDEEFSLACSWADYDNDSYVDLLVVNGQYSYLAADGVTRIYPTCYNSLYHNNGDGTFTKIQSGAGGDLTSEDGLSTSCAWSDFDNDGDVDVAVTKAWLSASQLSEVVLYKNNGNGTFSRFFYFDGIDIDFPTGISWGDYDNDGDFDMLVTASTNPYSYTVQQNIPLQLPDESEMTTYLFTNTGGNFSLNNTYENNTAEANNSQSSAWGDYDNDGDLDLFVANEMDGHNYFYINQTANNNPGAFTRHRYSSITKDKGRTYGCGWGDMDRDGKLDLVVGNIGDDILDPFVQVYKNVSNNQNKWAQVRCKGVISNKAALGAKVYVTANNMTQLREVRSQSGGRSQQSMVQQFGLGNASIINSMQVVWPSGIMQNATFLQPNTRYTLVETAPIVPETVKGCKGSSVAVTAQGGEPGSTYKWYDAATGGNVLSTQASYTLNPLNANTTLYVSCVPPVGPESPRVPVTFEIYEPQITISPAVQQVFTGSPINFTVDLSSTGLSYLSYQWYKDGFPIQGATMSNFLAVQPGLYAVKVLTSCGPESYFSANTGVVTLNCTPGATYTNPNITNTVTWSGNFSVDGTVTITQGGHLTIQSANATMQVCSGFLVQPGGRLTINNSTLTGCGPETWRGIEVQGVGNSATRNAPIQGEVHLMNATIENASFIVQAGSEDPNSTNGWDQAKGGGFVSAVNSTFLNNKQGFIFAPYSYPNQSMITGCTFKGLNAFNEACAHPPMLNPAYQKFIWMDDVQDINISSCSFMGNEQPNGFFTNQLKNVMEMRSCSNINFTFNTITGILNNGIIMHDKMNDDVNISDNDFLTDMDMGIHAESWQSGANYRMTLNNNQFGTLAGYKVNNPVVIRDFLNSTLSNNTFYNADNGIQFYSYIQYSAFAPPTDNTIEHNWFKDCRLGLVMAPLEHPETTSTMTGNNNLYAWHADILCNKFEDNEVAIFGSNRLNVQGTMVAENSNQFIDITDWDIFWGDATLTYHYQFYTPNSNVNLQKSAHYLNGTLVSSPNLNLSMATGSYCAAWKKDDLAEMEETQPEKNSKVSVYPNPFNNILTVEFKSEDRDELRYLTITDALGRQVYSYKSADKVVSIDLGTLAPGLYNLMVTGASGDAYTEKIIKVEH